MPSSTDGRTAHATVLDAKLRPPRTLGAAVRRGRLLELLGPDDDLSRTVTLVSAPAGAGKTMLLAQWCRELRDQGRTVAWLSLDNDDNDPFTFWKGVLKACRRAFGASSAEAPDGLKGLRPPADPSDPGFLASLYGVVDSLDEPLCLIVDDAHELTEPTVLDGLSRVLRTAPPKLQLVLGCRFDPPLPIPRMVLDGSASEIRADALAFNRDEAAELLHGHGIELVDELLSLLLARTEGWAAGLKLAAMALTRQKDAAQYLETFAGDDQPVADYLVTEILSQLTDDERAFLVVTSVPETLTADLAAELTGKSDAGSMLDELAHNNVLVYRRDSSPKLYHYHSLLRSYLLAELNRLDRSAAQRLHARAAEWFTNRGAPGQAVAHAAAARDWEQVVHLIDRHGLRLWLSGERAVVMRALEAIPEGTISDPRVLLVAAITSLSDGKLAAAQAHLDRTGRDPSVHEDSRLRLLHVTAVMNEARLRGEHSPRVRRLVSEAQVPVVDDPDLELIAAVSRGAMLLALGDYADADSDLTHALDLATTHRRDFLALECLSNLTLRAAGLGDTAGMRQRAQDAIDFATERGWGMSAPMQRTYQLAAWSAWLRAEVDDADRLLSLAAAVDADAEPSQVLSMRVLDAYVTFARTGDRARLVNSIRTAWMHVVEELVPPPGVSQCCVTDLRSALMLGEQGWAKETIARAQRLLGDDAPDVVVLNAMMDVHHGRNVAARTKLEPILSGEQSCLVASTEIAAWLLDAQMADVNDEPARAHAAVTRALELAAPQGLITDLTSSSDQVRRLLIHGRGRFGSHDEFVGEVLAAANKAKGALDQMHAAETLTSREVEFLRELPSMLSLDEIARAHVVSVNTVKTHLKALYRKLEVASRRDAVAKGRELGLI